VDIPMNEKKECFVPYVCGQNIEKSAFCSVANALCHLEYYKEAKEVMDFYDEYCKAKTKKPLNFLIHLIQTKKSFYQFRRKYYVKKWKYQENTKIKAKILHFTTKPLEGNRSKFIDSGFVTVIDSCLIDSMTSTIHTNFNLTSYGIVAGGYMFEMK
jgi:hypothetical protein